MTGPEFGKLVTDADAKRDAVHVAVIPMTAVRRMMPGEKMINGVVDPFLSEPVQVGQRFWLFIYPGTVTGIRHAWQHPAFSEDRL